MPKPKAKESNEPIDIPDIQFPKHDENEVVVSDKKKDKEKSGKKQSNVDVVDGKENEGDNGGFLDSIGSVFNPKERLKAIYLQRPQLAKLTAPKEVSEVDAMDESEVKGRIAICEAQLANETSGSVAEATLFGVSSALDKFLHLDGRLVQRNMSDESLKNSIKTVLGSRLFVYLSEEVKLGALFGLNTVSAINEKKQDQAIRDQVGNIKSNGADFKDFKDNNNIVAAATIENNSESKEHISLSSDPNKIF